QSESVHSDVSSTESIDNNGVDYSEPVVTAAPLGSRADVDVDDSGATGMVDEDEDVGEGQALLTPLGLLDGGEENSAQGEDGGSSGHADDTNSSSRANSLSDSRPRGTFDRRGVNGFPERRQIPSGSRIAGSHKQLQQQPASSPIVLSGSGGSLGCPICLGTICEAFMTACGHSFCYRCISRHLLERHTCPTCQQPLESDQIFPNFTLNKLITHGSPDIKPLTGSKSQQQQQQQQRVSSILDQVRSSVETGDGLDSEDIDTLLTLLQQKKQAMRSYKRQFEMATMRQFLLIAQAKKAGEMEALRKELTVVEEDLDFVSTQLDGFAQSSETFNDGARARECAAIVVCGKKNQMAEGAQVPNNAPLSADETALLPRNKRVEEHFADLESFYFNTRMRGVGEEGLDEFLETLTTFARHEKFRPVATLRYGDSTASTAIVASIEFDRDDEIFAVAGVTRKIKIYDYGNVIEQAEAWSELAQYQQQKRGRQQQQQQHSQDWWNREVEAGSTNGGGGGDDSGMMATALQYPVAEFTNRSKISCLSFNPYIKSQLACSDYDGTVSLWDVGVGTSTLSLGEHEKRAWSVDFSHVDPTRLCSGSDDGKVKIWTTNRRASVMTIEGKANVCCVRFNPLHGNILSFGSADHNVHCFDLRSPKQPLCVLRGHRKAVSYTR
ncbi:hypothetical protein GGF37_005594, partial [Kickxella alabastrina]